MLVSEEKKLEPLRKQKKRKPNGPGEFFGVGGVFGYQGTFTNPSLGRMTWYVTRKVNAVLIKTANGSKIIVTPNEPDNFVRELNRDYGPIF